MNRADRLEELGGLADGHLEHLGDVLALVVHLEGIAVVALSSAHLARDVHVGEEVHLDLDGPVTRAVLAAAPLDVEAETARLVSACLGFHRLGEQAAHSVEDTRVRCRVRARRPPDRRLVDVNDLVKLLEPGHTLVLAWHLASTVELVGEHLVEDVVHQARLARPAHSRHGHEGPQGELHGDVAQVVGFGALNHDLSVLIDRPPGARYLDRTAARDVVTGDRAVILEQRRVVTRVHDDTTVLPGAGADVDDPISGADRVLIVLDDDQGVAEVLELDQGLDEAPVVALVQADTRLVEHVQHAGQP